MRYRPERKQAVKERILRGAARGMRREGIAGASVGSMMAEAGLSHGGFYAHFESKDDMAAAGLAAAFAETREALFGDLGDVSDQEWMRQVLARYLGRAHRDAEDAGCPLPRLAGELARAGGPLKQGAAQGLEEYASAISARLAGGDEANGGDNADEGDAERRSHAYALLALMVGGVALARVADDPVLSDLILRACRRAAQIQAQ